MLLDRLGRRIEAGCVLVNVVSGSVQVVLSLERSRMSLGRSRRCRPVVVHVGYLVLEQGDSLWEAGRSFEGHYSDEWAALRDEDMAFIEVVGSGCECDPSLLF